MVAQRRIASLCPLAGMRLRFMATKKSKEETAEPNAQGL